MKLRGSKWKKFGLALVLAVQSLTQSSIGGEPRSSTPLVIIFSRRLSKAGSKFASPGATNLLLERIS